MRQPVHLGSHPIVADIDQLAVGATNVAFSLEHLGDISSLLGVLGTGNGSADRCGGMAPISALVGFLARGPSVAKAAIAKAGLLIVG